MALQSNVPRPLPLSVNVAPVGSAASWLVLLPLLLVWWALWRGQDGYGQLKKVVAPHLLEHLVVGEPRARRLQPVHVLSVIWILAALALAGPAWDKEPAPFADDDAGLVVLLKVSGTMQATDVQPSRLARAKHKLRDLLQARQELQRLQQQKLASRVWILWWSQPRVWQWARWRSR